MRYINLFYLFAILSAVLLWKVNDAYEQEVVLFHGFAENKETQINFNYPTAVGKIHVSPGQLVKKGEPLCDLYRIKAKEVLDDQQFKIQELNAKQKIWRADKDGEIKILERQKELKLERLDADIRKLREEIAFQESLYKDLKTIDNSSSNYQPLSDKIATLEKERSMQIAAFDEKVSLIRNELEIGITPYDVELSRIRAEGVFKEENKIIHDQLVAPSDGVIGNIHCKEEEHIPSFETLVTFYEPNPTLVKGYVHENLIVHVSLKDSFMISSIKDERVSCYGTVTGLGSRIVEIPERLRKMPDLKTYGREVLVQIPATNNFLQKEKVILKHVNPPKGLKDVIRKKPLVDLKLE